MNTFDRLLHANTETEFFIILCSNVRPGAKSNRPQHTHITSADLYRTDSDDIATLKFAIEQSFSIPLENGGILFKTGITHLFTLDQDGTLTWEMVGQPPLLGLSDIQAALSRLRVLLEPALLAKTA